MSYLDFDEDVTRQLREQKGLLLHVERSVRAIEQRSWSFDRLRSSPGDNKSGRYRRPADLLLAAAVSELLRPVTSRPGGITYTESAAQVAEKRYPGDVEVQRIIRKAAMPRGVERAAVPPATTTNPGYAAELVQVAVIDFLNGAAAPSAFAQLAGYALNVGLLGQAKIAGRDPLSITGGWVGEGAPHPVHKVNLTSTDLIAYKLAVISFWTEELAERSTPTIEAVMRDSLSHDLNALLDSSLLDANAGSAIRPPGLFNSAASVTASTLSPKTDAMLEDLGALSAAVSTNAPDARPLYFMNGRQAMRFKMSAGDAADVIVSNYMAPGSVGCVDASAVVTMTGGMTFTASADTTIHADTVPAEIAGSGATEISAPTISVFQANLLALRTILRAGWAKRRSGAAALCTSVTW